MPAADFYRTPVPGVVFEYLLQFIPVMIRMGDGFGYGFAGDDRRIDSFAGQAGGESGGITNQEGFAKPPTAKIEADSFRLGSRLFDRDAKPRVFAQRKQIAVELFCPKRPGIGVGAQRKTVWRWGKTQP